MMIRYKHHWKPCNDRPMSVEKAVAFALSDSDPEARAADTAEIVGRLITVCAGKGLLLPDEVIEVLGRHNYELSMGDGKET